MKRKPLTPRNAIITIAAAAAGSTAGTLAENVATHFGHQEPGISQLATAVTVLWILEKLDRLIGPDDDPTTKR